MNRTKAYFEEKGNRLQREKESNFPNCFDSKPNQQEK